MLFFALKPDSEALEAAGIANELHEQAQHVAVVAGTVSDSAGTCWVAS